MATCDCGDSADGEWGWHYSSCPLSSNKESDVDVEEIKRNERNRIAKMFEDEANATPLGAEDDGKGKSIYNWLMYAARKIREQK